MYKTLIIWMFTSSLLTACNDTSPQSEKEAPSTQLMIAPNLQQLMAKTKKLAWPVTFTSQELSKLATENTEPGYTQNFGYWVVNDGLIAFLYFQNHALYYNIHLVVYDAQTGKVTADKVLGAVGVTRLGGVSYEHNCHLSLKTKIDLISKTKMEPVTSDERAGVSLNRYCKINSKGLIQMKEY